MNIEYENFTKKLFLRYSHLIRIEQLVRSDFPNLNFASFITNKNWFYSHKTKTIESRKLHIENFLQTLFQYSEVVENPMKILILLELPLDFYSLKKNVSFTISNKRIQQLHLKAANEKDKYGSVSVETILTQIKFNSNEKIHKDSYISQINEQKTVEIRLSNGKIINSNVKYLFFIYFLKKFITIYIFEIILFVN